jgi:hypothetical protein
MKVVGSVIAGSLILFAAGCSRHDSRDRIASPRPRGDTEGSSIVEAHWVTEGDALRSAIRAAAGNPLVERALADLPALPRVQFVPAGAAHALGTLADGGRIRATILPFGTPRDSTYAVFVTMMEDGSRSAAQATEVILGRIPTAAEPGYELSVIGGRRFWFRSAGSYAPAPGGAIRRAPERTLSKEFIKCFLQNVVPACGMVAEGCRRVALPEYVGGCVVGGCLAVAAFVGVACAFGFLNGS